MRLSLLFVALVLTASGQAARAQDGSSDPSYVAYQRAQATQTRIGEELAREFSFSDYEREMFSGTPTSPNFSGEQRRFAVFRTRIRRGVEEGPNFAGRVSVIQFGCGTSCTFVYATDVVTGVVSSFPQGGERTPYLTLDGRPNSALMIATWQEWPSGGAVNGPMTCHGAAYVWNGQVFDALRSIDRPC
jgi:hypothetical protein